MEEEAEKAAEPADLCNVPPVDVVVAVSHETD